VNPNTKLRELALALRTLAPDQGRIARRNARRRVKKALAAIQKQVDADYPGVRRPRATPVRRPLAKRLVDWDTSNMAKRGWTSMRQFTASTITQKIGQLTEAGIKVKVAPSGTVFAPAWAVTLVEAQATTTALRRAKRSPVQRKAALTELALMASTEK
jgi:hypothetical protein